jgi:hypothetical protein
MEHNNISIYNFLLLNFNLKKIIFSFLNTQDQRILYWLNKKLRPLLPDSQLRINIKSIKKFSSYKFDGKLYCIQLSCMQLL